MFFCCFRRSFVTPKMPELCIPKPKEGRYDNRYPTIPLVTLCTQQFYYHTKPSTHRTLPKPKFSQNTVHDDETSKRNPRKVDNGNGDKYELGGSGGNMLMTALLLSPTVISLGTQAGLNKKFVTCSPHDLHFRFCPCKSCPKKQGRKHIMCTLP